MWARRAAHKDICSSSCSCPEAKFSSLKVHTEHSPSYLKTIWGISHFRLRGFWQYFANIKHALIHFCLSASHVEGRSTSFGIGLDTWLRISQLLERLSYLPDPTEWCDSTVIISPAVGWRAAERKDCISITLGHLLPSVISSFPSAPQHQLSSQQLYCILFTLHTLSASCDTVRPVSLTFRKQIWIFKTSLYLPFLPAHAQPCLPLGT